MKRILLTAGIIAVLALTATLMAGVPQLINYQGNLLSSSGDPLDTTVSIVFSLYTDSVGGTPFWTETHPSITTTNGLFTAVLGSQAKGPILTSILRDSMGFVGIKVGGDPEITPRTRLTSAPYAFHAGTVTNFHPGPLNVDSGLFTFVAGDSNTVLGDYSNIAGGYGNLAIGDFSAISGGKNNVAGDSLPDADTCSGDDAFRGEYPAATSGEEHHSYEWVGGGENNLAWGSHSGVACGFYNTAGYKTTTYKYGERSFVGGGHNNQTLGYGAAILGGGWNKAGFGST
jgi:hypothetical protein